jgi:excisionase family DNA binding protein
VEGGPQVKTTQPVLNEKPASNDPDRNVTGDRLLTIREVAALTGLQVASLYHVVSQGRITVVRLSKRCIRFRYSDLLEWIEMHTEKAREP